MFAGCNERKAEPMKKSDIIKKWALERVGSPYVYGGTGKECTPDYRKARAEQYPSYAANIKNNCPVLSGKQGSCAGCKYNGKRCYDCAQLTRYAAKAAGLELPSGASSQWNKAAWAEKGVIAKMPTDKVCFLYKEKPSASPMGHTGIYLGDGTACDARGHAYGVKHGDVSGYAWTHYAILAGMDDEAGDDAQGGDAGSSAGSDTPTLRRGSKGTHVATLQSLLLSLCYPLPKYGADGSFGAETENAVRLFQQESGLAIDGICGAKTWAALNAATLANVDPAKVLYTVTIPHLSAADATYLLEAYQGATSITET